MNQKELKELIEFLIEKDIAEFELERGDVKVKIKRGGQATVVHAHGEMSYPAYVAGGSGAETSDRSVPLNRLRAAIEPSPLRKKTCTS